MKLIPLILSTTLLVTPVAIPMAQAQTAQTLQFFPVLAGVDLTEAQLSQLEQLRIQTRQQVDGIVSPEQRQNFFTALQSGEGVKTAIADANLSDSQRTQVRNILDNARQQSAQILTVPQRLQMLSNLRAQWMDRF